MLLFLQQHLRNCLLVISNKGKRLLVEILVLGYELRGRMYRDEMLVLASDYLVWMECSWEEGRSQLNVEYGDKPCMDGIVYF